MNLQASLKLMRFDKPVGAVLLLWPCWWALVLAVRDRPYAAKLWIIFTLGVFVMRSAGCIANDVADRNFDGFVERTKARPLVSGEISICQAISLMIGLLFVAFCLVLQLNAFTVALSFAGAGLAITYPFMKRFIRGPQLFLGIAFSWSIPMVFAAANRTFDGRFYYLFFMAVLWPVIYDTFYAITDRKDDLKIGINSTAIWFGEYDKIILTVLQLLFAGLLLGLPSVFSLSDMYYVGLLPTFAVMLRQLYLIYQDDRQLAFKAFLLSQWQGGWIFVAICLGYYF